MGQDRQTKYQELVEVSLENQNVSDNIDKLKSKRDVEEKLTKVSEVLKNSALECIHGKMRKKKLGKLQILNKNISNAYKEMKKANLKWYEEGKPDNDHPLLIDKKICKQQFRKTYRIELAIKEINFRSKIMQTRTKNSKTFHMIIKKQRRSLRGCIQDLHIDNKTMSGEENILQGFKNHFANLSMPSYDQSYNYQYSTNIEQETDNIIALVKSVDILKPTKEELNKASSSIKKTKESDVFDLTVEHFIYGGDALLDYTHSIILAIFESGIVPDMIKERLLSPVFKNKRSILDINNYRGITVLPVFEKIVESILKKNRVRSKCDKQQCSIQRGFTQNSAPINSSFILEELRQEALDLKQLFIIILLDAKSAFDVDVHQSMMRRLFHLGVQDKHWTLINSLHTNASSAVKFNGLVSDIFEIQQGDRQGES